MSNLMITYISGLNENTKCYKTVTEQEFQRVLFERFVDGSAGYIIESTADLHHLCEKLKYTNVCCLNYNLSNKNYTHVASSVPEYIKNQSTKEIKYPLLAYTVGSDFAGSYDISPKFIQAVNDVLGSEFLTSIRRVEFAEFCYIRNGCDLFNDNYVGESDFSTVYTKYGMGYISHIPAIATMFPTPLQYDDSRMLFMYARLLCSNPMTTIIEMINKVRDFNKDLEFLQKRFARDILDSLSSSLPSMDLVAFNAILSWFISPKQIPMILYVNDSIKEFVDICSIFGFVIPPLIEDGCHGYYIYLNADGNLEFDTKLVDIPTFKLADDCDIIIKGIWIAIKKYAISPAGMNILKCCKYPFIDNIPTMFWNGNLLFGEDTDIK